MADVNEVVVNENGTVTEDDGEQLTGTEKAILAGTAIGIGAAGYLLGTYVVAPLIRKAKSKTDSEFERAKKESKRKKKAKRSRSGVDYDEDADFREVHDDDED